MHSSRAALSIALLGILALVDGCYAHVTLPPPPSNAASAEERRQYAQRMGAVGITRQVSRRAEAMGPVGVRLSRKQVDSLELGDGTLVRYPEDLIPVVGADSLAGRAAQHAGEARDASTAWAIGAAGVAAGGGAVFAFGGPLTGSELVQNVGIVIIAAAIVPASIAVITSFEATDLRREAFDAYARFGP